MALHLGVRDSTTATIGGESSLEFTQAPRGLALFPLQGEKKQTNYKKHCSITEPEVVKRVWYHLVTFSTQNVTHRRSKLYMAQNGDARAIRHARQTQQAEPDGKEHQCQDCHHKGQYH